MKIISNNNWQIKSRYLILILIIALITTFILLGFLSPGFFDDNPSPLSEISFDYIFYVVWGLLIYLLGKKSSIRWKNLFGSIKRYHISSTYMVIALPLIAISFAGIYLIYYPLSIAFPEIVKFVLIESDFNLFWFAGTGYRLANILSFFSIVIITPIIEELFFRGLLLTSLSLKLGIWKAIFISSFIFSLFHVDIIGSMIFGIVVSIIYLKTKSLLAPVTIHVVNNMLVFIASYLLDLFSEGNYTLIDFQNELWLGVIGFIIGMPWLINFFYKEIKGKKFNIPYQTNSVVEPHFTN